MNGHIVYVLGYRFLTKHHLQYFVQKFII